jgi:putative flippase GtrA
MQETNITVNASPSPVINSQESHIRDYEFALIIGVIIGIALLPTVGNLKVLDRLNVGAFRNYFYAGIILAMPLLALAGIFIARVLLQRFAVLWQFAKFGLIGVSNTALNFGVFNILIHLTGVTKGLTLSLFSALAFLTALINSYIWNSHWSFQNNNPRTPKEFFQFFAVTFTGLLINSLIIYIVTQHIPPVGGISAVVWANVANLIATLVVMFWNFSGFKFIVFKK